MSNFSMFKKEKQNAPFPSGSTEKDAECCFHSLQNPTCFCRRFPWPKLIQDRKPTRWKKTSVPFLPNHSVSTKIYLWTCCEISVNRNDWYILLCGITWIVWPILVRIFIPIVYQDLVTDTCCNICGTILVIGLTVNAPLDPLWITFRSIAHWKVAVRTLP